VYANEVMADRVLKSDGFKLKDHCAALEASFEQVEKEFLGLAERDGLSDGTTAVVALVQADRLTVAHVGDSRGVLCRNGNALALTQDHKPEIAAERRRIEALGGFVSYIGCWRAMGILAMSRAIGDLFLKPYVSAKPDVSTMSIGPTDEFIVLASDGVFDVFDNDQASDLHGPGDRGGRDSRVPRLSCSRGPAYTHVVRFLNTTVRPLRSRLSGCAHSPCR